MTARVHIVTLITGECSDVSRQVVGAYLDYSKALARKEEIERLIEKHGLNRDSIRTKLADAFDDTSTDEDETDRELAFAKDIGVDYVYVSYTGLFVSLSSYYLNG